MVYFSPQRFYKINKKMKAELAELQEIELFIDVYQDIYGV